MDRQLVLLAIESLVRQLCGFCFIPFLSETWRYRDRCIVTYPRVDLAKLGLMRWMDILVHMKIRLRALWTSESRLRGPGNR
jgi:hypothetical protein